MKKKIITILTWPLEKLYLFRIDHCFLLPSECRRLMAAHTAKVQSEFQDLRHKFKEGVLQLAQVKEKSTSVQYEVKVYVNRAALETTAGGNAAVADISLAIAKQLVERHKRSKAAEDKTDKSQTVGIPTP